jgi:4-carboxymuconolactone decarboxylase
VTRLPRLRPSELDDEQRPVYAAITEGRRSAGPALFETVAADGSLQGPFNAMLHAPRLGLALQRVGEVLRFESSLPARARELAILAVAAATRCEYEWYAHTAVARHLGVPEEVPAALAAGRRPAGVDAVEAAVLDLIAVVLPGGPVPDAAHAAARDVLGEQGVVEVVALCGYYRLLADLLRTFEVPLPDGAVARWDAGEVAGWDAGEGAGPSAAPGGGELRG